MSKSKTRKFKVGAHVVFLLSLLLPLSAQAQEGQRAKVKAAPLEIKLNTPTPILCVGASLLLEMEIKNVSRKEVEIDKFDVWSRVFYSSSKPDGSSKGGGQGSGCAHCLGDFIFFHPGMSYWDSYSFALQDDFFQSVADYMISVSINSVASNEVTFKLIDCGMQPAEVTK